MLMPVLICIVFSIIASFCTKIVCREMGGRILVRKAVI